MIPVPDRNSAGSGNVDAIGTGASARPSTSTRSARMADVRTRVADTFFAWSGPTTNGSAAYFRIQGPTLVIEYSPQGSVDHIHTIYRDPTNDYGAKYTK